MRITFNVGNLDTAGPQRVLTDMANHWAGKGWSATVITYGDASPIPFFPLHPSVKVAAMDVASPYSGLFSALVKNVRSTCRLRQEIIASAAECVIAFGETNGVRCLIATIGLKVPVIVSEQANPHFFISTKNGWIWDRLRSLVYPLARAVVVLTERNRQYFRKTIRDKTVVIPNAVPDDVDSRGYSAEKLGPLPTRTIAAMGRFSPEKRFDLLLQAFSTVASNNDCHLALVGDGPLRLELEQMVKNLGLSTRVIMPGFVQNPWPWLKDALMFVLSSESEAFPMVLLEAMAHGLPAVSFDCPMGPREIIRHEMDGILVPPGDVEGLAAAMERLIKDDSFRESLGHRARGVTERFNRERILGMWEDLVLTACRNSRPDAVCKRY